MRREDRAVHSSFSTESFLLIYQQAKGEECGYNVFVSRRDKKKTVKSILCSISTLLVKNEIHVVV